MGLVIIDGVLCCPAEEFAHGTTFLGLQEKALTDGGKYAVEKEAEERYNARSRVYSGQSSPTGWWSASYSVFHYMPDTWLVEQVRKCIKEACDSAVTQIGEEDIGGRTWTIPDDAQYVSPSGSYYIDRTGRYRYPSYADLSLTGPATLGGKIALELAHRLLMEVRKDEHAEEQYTMPELPIYDIAGHERPKMNNEKECDHYGKQHRGPAEAGQAAGGGCSDQLLLCHAEPQNAHAQPGAERPGDQS